MNCRICRNTYSPHSRRHPRSFHPLRSVHRCATGSSLTMTCVTTSARGSWLVTMQTLSRQLHVLQMPDSSKQGSRCRHPSAGALLCLNLDQSPSLDGSGPRTFGRRIQKAPFPLQFRPPINVIKYIGEMNLVCDWKTTD